MKTFIQKKPLVSFYVLAYLLSWLVWVPLIFAASLGQELIQLIMLVGVLGPMGAAIIVSKITGTTRAFWRSTLKWRVPFRWHLAALGIPLLVLLLVLGVYHFFGVADPSAGTLLASEALPWYTYPLMLLFMIFIGGGMEEPGWRGFAQPRMLALFTPFSASVILGIIWTYWHAPLFFVPYSAQQGMELGWYTAAVTSLAITLTWLYIKSKGSAFIAIVFHGGINAINSWIPVFKVPVAGLEFSSFAVLEFMNVLVALVILVTNGKIFFRRMKPEKNIGIQ